MWSAVCYIVSLIANWFIFKKMGREGWEGIVPIYNIYVLFKEIYGNGWRFLLILVPLYNIYVIIKFCIDMAHVFNKGTGFGIGLLLLSPIFDLILAFDNSVYRDGSYANKQEDFLTKVGDDVRAAANNVMNGGKDDRAVEKIRELKSLLDAGVITEQEFEEKKAELMAKI